MYNNVQERQGYNDSWCVNNSIPNKSLVSYRDYIGGFLGFSGSQAKFTDRDKTSRTEERGAGKRALYTTISYPFLPAPACSATYEEEHGGQGDPCGTPLDVNPRPLIPPSHDTLNSLAPKN